MFISNRNLFYFPETMPDLQYTPDQQSAIDYRGGNLLILACAGSGKTEVVARRIANLVSEGVAKESIVAFTFNERAAEELKARIRGHLEDVYPQDPEIGEMYVGTIHSFCLQILKETDPTYRNYEVMDDAGQAALISRYYYFDSGNEGIGLHRLEDRVNGGYWRTIGTFTKTLSIVHQQNILIDDISDDVVQDAIRRYYDIAYDNPNYFFDFDRIISELLELLESEPDVLESLRERFQHIVVDEYQDVDGRQERLVALLSDEGRRAHVTAVGDDDQSIYGWRGTEVENILTFSDRYPDVEEIKLDFNFRSTHAIAEIANSAIRELPVDERIDKTMEARHWNSETEAFEETLSEEGDIQLRTFGQESTEAEWIAQRIHQLRGTIVQQKDGSQRAIDYGDMAVLLRSVKSSGGEILQALEEEGIPSVVKGTGDLFGQDETMLIQAAFCRLADTDLHVNTADDYHVLDEGQTREYIREKIADLRDTGAIPTARTAEFLEWIAAKREELNRKERGEGSRRIYPQDILHEMIAALGSQDSPQAWPQQTLFNLGRVSKLITQYEEVRPWVRPDELRSLCMFLGGWAAGTVDEGSLDESHSPNAV